VASAVVRILFDVNTASTTPEGRFRFGSPPSGQQIVEIDGRFAGAPGAGQLGRYRLAVGILGDRADLPAPVVLPDLSAGASAAVAVGVPLVGVPDLDAPGPGGTTYSLVFDRADGTHPAAVVDPSSPPGAATVDVTATVVSLQDFPLPPLPAGFPPLASSAGLDVEPLELTFSTGASLCFPNDLSLPPLASAVLMRLDRDDGTWQVAGTATVDATGTVVESFNEVREGGLHAIGVQCPAGAQGTLSGTVLDDEGNPVPDAYIVAPDAQTARTDRLGAWTIAGVCLGASPPPSPVPVVVRLSSGNDATPALAPSSGMATAGTETNLGAATLRTRAGSVARVRVIFEGRSLPGVVAGVGSDRANFGGEGTTDEKGLFELFLAPSERYFGSVSFMDGNSVRRGLRSFHVGTSGKVDGTKLFTTKTKFKTHKVKEQVRATVVRVDSGAPVQDALAMLGTDPTVKARRHLTNRDGQALLSKAKRDPATLTAGFQWCTDEGVLPTGPSGQPVSERQLTTYVTVVGVDSRDLRIELPVLDAVLPGFDCNGRIPGTISGLTDPAAVPPSNPSGTYAVSLSTQAPGEEADFWDAFGEGPLDDFFVPVGDSSVGYPAGGGPPDFSYSPGSPVGNAALVAVERDSTDPNLGPVVRSGFVVPVPVSSGLPTTADLALDLVSAAPFPIVTTGLDPALMGGPSSAEFAVALDVSAGTPALVRFGDVTSELTFDPVTGLGNVLLPATVGPLSGASRLVRLLAAGPVAGGSGEQEVFLSEPPVSSPSVFPAVPVLLDPAPGAPFLPTSAGLLWTEPTGATFQRIRLTRTDIVVQGTAEVERSFEWIVFLPVPAPPPDPSAPPPPGVNAFVFPTLPTEVSDQDIPQFFEPGATYDLVIDSLVTGGTLTYEEIFTFPDVVGFSDDEPLGRSSFATTVTEP
jgi:hypothetical protein